MPNPADLDLFLAEVCLLKADLQLQDSEVDPRLRQLAIVYTYDSNRLEGSSLDLSETQMVIRNGIMVPGKPMAENLSALNHYQAIKFIREHASEKNLLSISTQEKNSRPSGVSDSPTSGWRLSNQTINLINH